MRIILAEFKKGVKDGNAAGVNPDGERTSSELPTSKKAPKSKAKAKAVKRKIPEPTEPEPVAKPKSGGSRSKKATGRKGGKK